MTNTAIRAALICVSALCSTAALAKVEVQAVQHKSLGPILLAKVSEDIAPGDYEVLMKGILGNPGKFAKRIVLLDSIGGSVPEAIKMGRLLRETGFAALVPATGVCQGSCVYLLAAGRDRTVRGYVGIHRPYYPNGDSARAESAYNGVKYSPAAYFREMHIPPSLAEAMHSVDPQNMRVLSPQELARYRLN